MSRVRRLVVIIVVVGAVALAWAASDADYEGATGLDKALAGANPTMASDTDVEGKSFEADGAFGQAGCKAKFEFARGKKGTYPYQAAGGRTTKGVYVKIKASFDKTKCEAKCAEVKILQVRREYTKDGAGAKVTADPGSPQRRERSGWKADGSGPTSGAASPGWLVDSGDNKPFYGPGFGAGLAENGSTDTPSTERDAPGHFDESPQGTKTKNIGKEFRTCAVCVNPGAKAKIIACLNWGYYIDKDAKVGFDPKPPTASATPPQEAKDALDRF